MGGLLSCSTLAHAEELIRQLLASAGKPSYAFGKGATVTVNDWLDSGNNIPSNETGIPFGLSNGQIVEVWVGNKNLVAYDLSIYHHLGDETSLTLIVTLTIPAGNRTATFNVTDFGILSVPIDVQIAMRVTAVPGANPRSVSAHATITGSS